MYILRTVRVWGEKGEGTWDSGGYEGHWVYIIYLKIWVVVKTVGVEGAEWGVQGAFEKLRKLTQE